MSALPSRFCSVARIAALLAVALLASACATTPGRTTNKDPYEGFNRKMDKFNDTIDRAALKPVAKAYNKVTPRPVRRGVSNFFANLEYPTTFINQFLQGKFVLGLRDTGRFLVNSTLGIAGLFDVASKMNLPANDEDFGQTLAVWGVASGPYLVLPFFGPSNFRDGPSRIPDEYTYTLHYIDMSWEAKTGLRAVDLVSERAELLSLDQTMSKTYDRYAFIRDAWVQRREYNIFDGEPPMDDLEDEAADMDDEAAAADSAGAEAPSDPDTGTDVPSDKQEDQKPAP
ncbi:MAG TPA: VacJ family lipoprotein [Steroidobacteraceae bacterium]|nr:VacJ family lipoprotein [Steroidobacteraceae bacterium]